MWYVAWIFGLGISIFLAIAGAMRLESEAGGEEPENGN
jgi:cyd operon protein YbgT